MHGLFITGTGTDVGKTVVAAAALHYFLNRTSAAYMKPIQTGAICEAGRLRSPDLDFVMRTLRLNLTKKQYDWAAPYRFRPACSPHLAARLAKQRISLRRILESAECLARRYEFLVIEGAGGIMVPLTESETMMDLALAFGFPSLIASPAGLGALNHTLLTVHALRHAKLPIAGISLWAKNWGDVERDNVRTLRRKICLPVIAFPYCASARSGRLSPSDLRAAARSLAPILASVKLQTA